MRTIGPLSCQAGRTAATGRASLVRAVALCTLALVGAAAPGIAAPAVESFGPGKVNCQALNGDRMDCLLAASLVTQASQDVTSFGLTDLPADEQAGFRRWCASVDDNCTVTVTGQREAPLATRLAAVTSIHWTRLSAPVDQAAARAMAR